MIKENYIIQIEEKEYEVNKDVFNLIKIYIDNNIELMKQQQEFIKYLAKEKYRLAREVSAIYENDLGKTKLVNEDIFNEVCKILGKYKEIIGDVKNDR